MDYILSRHAKERIVQRSIQTEWIDRTLENPAKIEPDEEEIYRIHAFLAISELNDNVLHVIYDSRKEPVKIIAVYFDRSMKGKR